MGHRGTFAIPPLVNFAHFRKVDEARRGPDFPKDLAVRMPSVDRRSRLSQVEPELLVFC